MKQDLSKRYHELSYLAIKTLAARAYRVVLLSPLSVDAEG
jgi:hypothetical protein